MRKKLKTGDVIVEMNQAYDDELMEERLAKVYFNLVNANSKRKK